MKRFSTHSVDEILKHIYLDSPKILLGDNTVKTSTPRLLTYTKGIVCVNCGLKGKFFAVESNGSGAHLNLYGYKDGNEVLITSDHIFPLSKGGEECIENRQCLCSICNSIKNNDIPESGGIQNVRKAAGLERQRMMNDIKHQINNLKAKMSVINGMSLKKFIKKFMDIKKDK